MPYLISTPEDWFRIQKRDLHLIRVANEEQTYSKNEYLAAQKKLHAWFADNLPHVSRSVIGPSDYSGWIEGGPCYITADLNPSDINTFSAAWDGNSFWRLEIWPFDDWLKRVESANLLTSPACHLQKLHSNFCSGFIQTARWWDTPKGVLMLDAYSKGTFVDMEPGEHFLSLRDGWWRMQQLFPEFSGLEADTFPCGYFRTYQDKTQASGLMIEYSFDAKWDANEYAKDTKKIQHLKNVLGIGDEIPLEIYIGDF